MACAFGGVVVGVVGVVWLLAVGVTGIEVARLRRPCRLASSSMRRAMPSPYWNTAP